MTLAAWGWDGPPPEEGEPARVVRHEGAGLTVATERGVETVLFAGRLDPEPVVGDWVVVRDGAPVAVLPRRSLLRRRATRSEREQQLAANIDAVLIVCGLDRPVRGGRIQRAAALAWDAPAEPIVVLTKADLADDVGPALAAVEEAVPGLPVVVTSVRDGTGLDDLAAAVRGRTVALVGESGAGKSSIVNALLGEEVAATGEVRAGDAKGRHTTTARELHAVPGGGVVVDTPGIRAVGLWIDPDAVDRAFADLEDLAAECRFTDCAHRTEPGCAVRAAAEEGRVEPARLAAWQSLRAEAEEALQRQQRRRRR